MSGDVGAHFYQRRSRVSAVEIYSPPLADEAVADGFHRSMGLRAAAASSSLPIRVVWGADLTSSGSASASRAIDFMASMNKSSSSRPSLSVGSIIIAPGATSGK